MTLVFCATLVLSAAVSIFLFIKTEKGENDNVNKILLFLLHASTPDFSLTMSLTLRGGGRGKQSELALPIPPVEV